MHKQLKKLTAFYLQQQKSYLKQLKDLKNKFLVYKQQRLLKLLKGNMS